TSLPSSDAMRYGLKWVAKNARTASLLAPSTRSLAAHGACQIARDFACATSARQPTTKAGQAAATGSSFHPGSSFHATGVNCARAEGAGGGGFGAGGTVWHAV